MFFKNLIENRCYKGGNQHNFEGRYDEKEAFPDNLNVRGMSPASFKLKTKTYIKDVCVWCGKEIKK